MLFFAAKLARYLILNCDHSKCQFGNIVIELYSAVMHESYNFPLAFKSSSRLRALLCFFTVPILNY